MPDYTQEQIEAERKRLASLPENQNEEGGITVEDAIRALNEKGTAGGTTSPVEGLRAKLDKDLTKLYGPTVAAQVLKLVGPQLSSIGSLAAAEQTQSLQNLETAAYAWVPTAQEKAREKRYDAFSDWYSQHIILPADVLGGTEDLAQNAVTSAALKRQEMAVWARFEEYYADPRNQAAMQPDVDSIRDFIATDGRGWMGEARPDLKAYNAAFQKGEAGLQFNRKVLSTQMRVQSAREKQVLAAKNRAVSRITTLMNALYADQDATDEQRAKLSGALDTLYDTVSLTQGYQTAGEMGEAGTADQYIAGLIGADVQDAFAGTKYEGAVVVGTDATGNPAVDLGATVAGVSTQRRQQDKRADLEGLIVKAQADNPDLDFSGIDVDKIMAGEAKVDPTKQVQAEIKKVTGAAKAEVAKIRAENYGQDANKAFQNLPPDVQARLRSRFGPDVAAMIFQQANSDPQRAANLFEDEVKIAEAESTRATGYRDTFSAANDFDLSKSPRLQEVLNSGRFLNEQDIGEATQAHRFYGAFENSLNPDGGSVEERRANAAKVTGELWKQAGGDVTKYQAALKARMDATPEVEQAWRATLPGYKTQKEQMGYVNGEKPSPLVPQGGLTGRASLAFQAQGATPERQAALKQEIADLDAKEQEAAQQAQRRRNPLPRGRKS